MNTKRNKIILIMVSIVLGVFIVFMVIKTYRYTQITSTNHDYDNDQYVQYGEKCLNLAHNSNLALCRISSTNNKISLINLKNIPSNIQGRPFVVVNIPKIIMNSNTEVSPNTIYCLDYSPSFKKIFSLQDKNILTPQNSNYPDTILPAGHSVCEISKNKLSAVVMIPFTTKVKSWKFILTSINQKNSDKTQGSSYQVAPIWQLTIN